MSKKTLIVATAALAVIGASAFAIEAEQPETPLASSATRAEVRAEMQQLKDAKALPPVTEASPSQLEASVADARIAQLQPQPEQQLALAQPSLPAEDAIAPLRSDDERIASLDSDASAGYANQMFVVPSGTIVIIESVPPDAGTLQTDGSLPFSHPALPGDAR